MLQENPPFFTKTKQLATADCALKV